MKNKVTYTFLLCLFTLSGFTLHLGTGQDLKSVYQTRIDLDLENASIEEVFQAISAETLYRFSYEEGIFDKEMRFTLQGKDQAVSDYLLQISREAHLRFLQVNQQISVQKIQQDELEERKRLEIVIQEITVTGKVTDTSDGSGLPGVNVVEKGTTNGTVTDLEGMYTVQVSEGATLVFSSVGYLTQEVEVGNSTNIDIGMEPDVTQLEELVVVGYGTQKRANIAGAVSSINLEEVEKTTSANVLEALQGRVAGLDITTNSNAPGAQESFLIRGTNSLTASNSPLIILDGITYYGSLNDINPNDIRSIEVLKDVSSTAIYGARASNGVILITSRRGKQGKPIISYNGRVGVQSLDSRTLDVTGVDGYIAKAREFARHEYGDPERWRDTQLDFLIENYENGEIVDWVDDMVSQNAPLHEHTLSISGANDRTNYFSSLNYFKEIGVFEGAEMERISGRFNFDYDITDYLTAGTRIQVTRIDNGGFTADYIGARRLSPFANYYEPDGETLAMFPLGDGIQGDGHPKGYSTYDTRVDVNDQLFTNLYFELRAPFLKGLSYRFNGGYTLRNNKDRQYRTRLARLGSFTGGTAVTGDRHQTNWLAENILKYNQTFDKHQVDLTLLYSREHQQVENSNMTGRGFPNDLLLYHAIQTAEEITGSTSFSEWSVISYMARLNYTFNSKYLLTLTWRRDGFSGFGDEKKWGQFPSAAIGWNISQEAFMSGVSLIDNLKLRVSYGLNGNQAVGAYAALASIGSRPYTFGDTGLTFPGVIPTSLPNPNLGWESTESFNIGLDFGILDNRLTGTLDMYKSMTYDLLLQRSIPTTNGFNSIIQNIGNTENWGMELTLSSTNIKNNDFTWTTDFNIFFNRNKIVDLYGNSEDDIGNRWFIDEPVRVAYDWEIAGFWQEDEADLIPDSPQPDAEPGFPKILDKNGDNQISAEDREILGRQDPDFIAGMTNTVTYKNFDLTLVLHGKFGGIKANDVYRYFNFFSTQGVQAERNFPIYNFFDIDYWTPENPDAPAPAIYMPVSFTFAQYWDNPTFVRIEQLSLGYTMPSDLLNRLPFEKLRVFITGRNLFSFTKFVGDPELASNMDYPMTSTISLGINIGL